MVPAMTIKRFTLRALHIFSLLSLIGCTSVYVQTSNGRFDTPEIAPAESRGRLQFMASGASRYVIDEDASRRPLTLQSSGPDPANAIELGWHRQLEGMPLELSVRGFGPSRVGLKYQLWQGVEKKWSAAIKGQGGLGFASLGGDQDGVFGRGGYDWNSSITHYLGDLTLIVGKRTSDYVMIYGGPFGNYSYAEGKIHHSEADNGRSPEQTLEVSGHGTNYGLHLGAAIDYPGATTFQRLFIETAVARYRWDEKITDPVFMLNICLEGDIF